MGQEPDVPRLEDGGWKLTLEHITRLAVKGLGLAEADAKLCEARLAQLTAVEAGRHSKERLDIKKQPGTLGKLLVQLPVVGCHTGGELHVKHEGRRQVFWRSAPPDGGGGHGAEERKAGPVELRYAAFYADCDTQLLPVESGRRVVLVYDLIRTGPQHPLCLLALRGDDLAALVSSAPCPAFARLVGAFGALPPVEVVRPAALAAGPWCAAAPLWWNPALPAAAGGAGLEADFPDLFTLGPLTSVGVAVRCWDAFRAVRVERAALRPGQPPSPRQRRRWTRQSFECEDTGDSDAEDVEPWDETSIVKWRNPGPRAGGKGKATASFPEELGLQGLLDQLEDRLLGGGELLSDEPGKRRQPDGAQLNNAALVVFWPRSHTASLPCAMGFGAGLAQLKKLLGSRDGNPGAAPALLEALLEVLQRKEGAKVSMALALLQLLASSSTRALGLEAQVAVAARVVSAVINMPRGFYLVWDSPAPPVANALAATATKLADPAFDAAVLQFVSARAAFNPELCLQLASSAALPDRLREGTCSALMGALLKPDAFRRQPQSVVRRLAGLVFGSELPLASYAGAFAAVVLARPDRNHALRALLKDPATHSTVLAEPAFNAALLQFVAASAASDLELCLQLAASAILPERLRDGTCSALMGSLLAPDVFRLRPLPFVHRLLAGLVFGPDPRFGAHSGAFADALLARPDAQEVLRALLRDAEAVIWAVKERRPQAVRLAQGRRRQLEAETAGGEPAVRWEMPGARLPAYPQVEAFLRGPQQSFRLNPRINNITHVAPSHGAHAPCSNVADPPTCFVVALLCEARL
ncbi:hypothetical protein HYH03_011963 [Edaphochlamys debaryana]|uniref:Uncharacterized protein n=1 Tax=Edaphochlamys debaryana TaxID=47281 RepID=A0A835XSX6_9CHLO|nr:hypothetical protein HYH03_011963 [Edaphochlamys debaryana]|eukprot:KAG2489511.1 hypothetical protein HYH03_011963 [Edaphochlamys debaryana]